jgi:hypothetical protein
MPLDHTRDVAQRGVIGQALEGLWQRFRERLGAAEQRDPKMMAAELPDVSLPAALDAAPAHRGAAAEQVGQLNLFSEEVTTIAERNEQARDIERERCDLSPEEQTEIESWIEAGYQAEEDEEWGDSFDDQVTVLKTSEWHVYAPGEEYRTHIGRSDEGYRYAVETSHQGGDDHENGLPWSQGHQTRAEAETAMGEAVSRLYDPEQEHEQGDEEHEL